MKYKAFILIALFFSSMLTDACESITLTSIKESDSSIRYKFEYLGKEILSNVQLSQRTAAFPKDWILAFMVNSNDNDFTFVDENEITIEQLDMALNMILNDLSDKKGINIGAISVDIGLIKSLWSSVVNSIKSNIIRREGVVRHKDKQITSLINQIIDESGMTQAICKSTASYGIHCSSREMHGINPVAFKPMYLRKSWDVLLNSEDAGIYKSMKFFINTRK